jgi:pimeloyl-ACP methyl ester carboxylesterase
VSSRLWPLSFRRVVRKLPVLKPLLLPMAERLGRLALQRRGVVSRRVATRLGNLHVYDGRGSGELPTTVLLHGIGSAATPFGPVLEHLRRDVRRVLAPEYPGHGFSDDADVRLTPDALFESVAAALDTLVDEPAIVIGNSLGGAVALHYALARPSRVRALVLVSPAGARASDEEWREIRSTFDIASRADASAFLRRLYHRPPWFLPLLAHEFPEALGRRAVRDLLETASNDHALSPDALGSLVMPVLLVWGASERLLPETHLDYFARYLPSHALIERPEGFGHCPHIDAPAALARRIVAFARSAGVARDVRAA